MQYFNLSAIVIERNYKNGNFDLKFSEVKKMATKSIKIDNFPKQIGLLAAALALAVAVVFVVKWCAANAIASHTIYREVAELAEDWAPADPQTHYTSAVLWERNFASEDVPKAVGEYERAAALSPNDYRVWLPLGQARERGGDRAGAEAALRKAKELAPNYAQIGWTLGNILLRENKPDEGFREMSRAAEGDRAFVAPTVGTAWQIFGGDLAQIKQALGDSPTVSAAFVGYLAREKRFDDAVQIWNSLPAEKRSTTFKTEGDALFEQMIAAGKYRAALQVAASSSDTAAEKFAAGEIFNGGFESDIKMSGATVFDWQIADGAQPVVGVDNRQKHGGERSLTMLFNSPTGRDFRGVAQIVAVESGAKYALEIFYKSELKTAATVYWEVAALPGGKVLAQTQPVAAASDWADMKIEFTAPQDAEAVILRLARDPCKSPLCPISGRIWFDDFSMVKSER